MNWDHLFMGTSHPARRGWVFILPPSAFILYLLSMTSFKAPWGGVLIGTSLLATALCAVVIASRWQVLLAGQFTTWNFWLSVLPLVLIFTCALFTILGYAITPDAILVRRLFWHTRLPLAELRSIEYQPNGMRKSWRTCGNGGLFSFSGWYRSSTLGNYRALVTEPRQTVILRLGERTWVLSPAEPERFVEAVRQVRPA